MNGRAMLLITGLIAAMLSAAAPAVFGEETGGRSPFTFDIEFDWLGLGVNLGYRGASLAPDRDTMFRLILMAVYDRYGYFRTPADEPWNGTPAGYDPAASPWTQRLSLRSALEFDQGILWNERDQQNKLEFFLAYKLRYEINFDDPLVTELLLDSSLPDRDRILQNSLFAGLEWKDVDRRHRHRLLSGTAAELSAEWGPEALANDLAGRSDFLRLNASARAFLPLFDLDPENPRNVFSAYSGFFAAVDFITGESPPLNVRQYFGGKYPRKGLGYAVRGLEDSRYDAPFKAVVNADLRFNLPAVLDPSLLWGVIVFFDAGYYHFVTRPENGFVFSAGGGIYLSLFDFLNLTFTTQWLLNTTRVTGEFWTPVYFAFIFHF